MFKIVKNNNQGSIIGPLLFIRYCSDILHFFIFADDTNLFYSSTYINDAFINTVNLELSKLSTWLCLNKLSLNLEKTNFMLFGHKRLISLKNYCVTMNNQILKRVEKTKFLGVYNDVNLTWKDHVSYISLKISRGLGVMNRVRKIMSRQLLVTLYNIMIYSYLSYCTIVWGSTSHTTLHSLIILQKIAIRFVTKIIRVTELTLVRYLNCYEFLSLLDIYKSQIIIYMYKVRYRISSSHCSRFFRQTVSSPRYRMPLMRVTAFFHIPIN